jgi:hypothetical protein
MIPITKILAPYKSFYAASKVLKVGAMQLSRLSKAGALVDKDNQVWIKSTTKLENKK